MINVSDLNDVFNLVKNKRDNFSFSNILDFGQTALKLSHQPQLIEY